MGGKGYQTRVFNRGFDDRRLQAVKACQLDAVITDLFNLFHGAGKIPLRVIAHGIDLHRNRQGFHWNIPPVSC